MQDAWIDLRRFTQARIAQGRAGCSLPTSALLDFQLAHAAARDAVHQPWDSAQFQARLNDLGIDSLYLHTQVNSREQYLQRPDLGRCLDQHSHDMLKARQAENADVALIVSNGLSSTAVSMHGLDLLQTVIAAYRSQGLSLAPVCLLQNARVAIADEIGQLLNARLAVIMLGERPGLSAADSLGIYMTYAPAKGNTDAERNCLSNIRPPEGLSYETAAAKLVYLSVQALYKGYSGVALKDDMPTGRLEAES